ncbi:MAG: energy transducer TonB [Blastocatellia bacterium]|nr:energy transducer TonB [Blastocatellia bacterium]
MPLKVRSFCFSIFAVISLGSINAVTAQTTPSPTTTAQTEQPRTPTSADVMRDRVSRAKAFIAVRNYAAAAYELETMRRETADSSVHSVVNVLLMSSYLEQSDYIRAHQFLNDLFRAYKANNANAEMYYAAAAGQVVRSARNKLERYRAFGLSVSDRNLPLEAVNDLEKMRETLELVVSQANELHPDASKAGVAAPLLEEATAARSSLARDDYDARRWRDSIADTREQMANSHSVIFSAVGDPTAPITGLVADAAAKLPVQPPAGLRMESVGPAKPEPVKPEPVAAATEPVVEELPAPRPAERQVRFIGNPPAAEPKAEEVKPEVAAPAAPVETGPMNIGSLLPYATRQSQPSYPPAARTMRAAGVVRVEVLVDEKGDVAEVRNASGNTLLQAAARDAIVKWKFRPFSRDGQPVQATGFVNFNFSL